MSRTRHAQWSTPTQGSLFPSLGDQACLAEASLLMRILGWEVYEQNQWFAVNAGLDRDRQVRELRRRVKADGVTLTLVMEDDAPVWQIRKDGLMIGKELV